MKYTSSLKLSKPFKRMISSTLNKEKRLKTKTMFLNATQSALNRSYIRPEKIERQIEGD